MEIDAMISRVLISCNCTYENFIIALLNVNGVLIKIRSTIISSNGDKMVNY